MASNTGKLNYSLRPPYYHLTQIHALMPLNDEENQTSNPTQPKLLQNYGHNDVPQLNDEPDVGPAISIYIKANEDI